MPLRISDPETEHLAAEVAALAGETMPHAVKVALLARRERLARRDVKEQRRERLYRFLIEEAWPGIPPDVLGAPLSRAERDAILGYGPNGV